MSKTRTEVHATTDLVSSSRHCSTNLGVSEDVHNPKGETDVKTMITLNGFWRVKGFDVGQLDSLFY